MLLKLPKLQFEVIRHRFELADAIHASLEDDSISLPDVEAAVSEIINEEGRSILIDEDKSSVNYKVAEDIFQSNTILAVCDLEQHIEGEDDYKKAASLIAASDRLNIRMEKLELPESFRIID